ncbi:MAG: hypothetical protein R3C56_39995 [Pirellulaceae bacterium]
MEKALRSSGKTHETASWIPGCVSNGYASSLNRDQESLFLYEVDEHQTVQHQGRIPLPLLNIFDALDERKKRFSLLLKLGEEPPRCSFRVKFARSLGDIDELDIFFFVE